MARPKIDKGIKRDQRMTVRFTDHEIKLIQDYARDMKLTPTECVRERCLHSSVSVHYDVVTRTDDIKPLTEEFHKIGINLNQIAHHLNSGDLVAEAVIGDIKEYIDRLRKLSIMAEEKLK